MMTKQEEGIFLMLFNRSGYVLNFSSQENRLKRISDLFHYYEDNRNMNIMQIMKMTFILEAVFQGTIKDTLRLIKNAKSLWIEWKVVLLSSQRRRMQ